MRVFALKSCDTCRKATKALAAAGVNFAVIDVRADGVNVDDQAAIVSQFGDASINRASTTWRGLSDDEKSQDPHTLLAAYPTLMKRPVVRDGDVWTIGWKTDAQKQWLGE